MPLDSFEATSWASRFTSSLLLMSPLRGLSVDVLGMIWNWNIRESRDGELSSLQWKEQHLRDDLSRTGVVLVDNVFQGLFATAGDVDFGTIGHQCLCDHQSYACSSTSDDRSEPGHIEKLVELEVFVGLVEGCHCSDRWFERRSGNSAGVKGCSRQES